MVKIFREVVDNEYPIISHKCFKINECCEHLINEKNILGYVVRGRKRVDDGIYINEGELFYMPINNYTVYYESMGYDEYEEITVCFDSDMLESVITTTIPLDTISSLILSIEDGASSYPKSEPATESVKECFYYMIRAKSVEDNSIYSKLMDKTLVGLVVFSILTSSKLKIGNILLNIIKRNNDKIRTIIKECVSQHLKIDQMAAHCSMSRSQFKKVFASIYGTSPHRFMSKLQLESAAFLLKTTDKSVLEISSECKFSNPSHLIKRFKEFYDETPTSYRKKCISK